MKRIILLISTLLLCFVFASCDFTEIESDNTTVPSNADVGEPSNTTEAPQPTAPTDTENITDTAPEEKLDKSIMDQIYEGMPQEELEKIIPKEQWLDDRYGYYRYIFSDGTSIRFRFEPMRPSKDSPEDTEYSGLNYYYYYYENDKELIICLSLNVFKNEKEQFFYLENTPSVDPEPVIRLDSSVLFEGQIYLGMPRDDFLKLMPKEQWGSMGSGMTYYTYEFSDGTEIAFLFRMMRPTKDSPEDTEYSGLSYLEYIDFTSCTILGEATYNKEGKFYYIEESPESTDTNTVS